MAAPPPPAAWHTLATALDNISGLVAVTIGAQGTQARDAFGTTFDLRPVASADLADLIDYLDARSLDDFGPRGAIAASRIIRPGLSYSVMAPPIVLHAMLVIRRWPAALSWRSAL